MIRAVWHRVRFHAVRLGWDLDGEHPAWYCDDCDRDLSRP